MRNPNQVLNSLKTKACNESYHYERLYRNLYNPEFYLSAYQRMYANEGNMTAGTDGKTIDGMGMDRINRLIESIKNHSYQPNPARRVYIEKKGNTKKKRPLGIPSFEDKLVQEVVRMILESIYEPTFSNNSHGFRTNKSCHTALLQIQTNFTGVKWFIEGDIKGFFDNIDHQTLVKIMRKRIVDEYFIALIWKFLKAGYMENWNFHNTYSGTPQGSIISPILSNIYLNEFDRYMKHYAQELKKGKKRKKSERYSELEYKLKYLRYKKLSDKNWNKMTDCEKAETVDGIRELRNKMLETEYSDTQDGGYRRMFYVRYADDWLCGITGSREDVVVAKADIREFLSDTLKLELSEEKTLITNAKDCAHFLGYDIFVSKSQDRKKDRNGHTRRTNSGKVKLYVPREKWQKKLMEYKALKIRYNEGREIFEPVHRTYLISNDDLEILQQYNSEIRGMYNYYRIADNVSVLGNYYYVMKCSMFKTFGAKYKLHMYEVRKKFGMKRFGVKYYTKSGQKTMYFYDEGFRKNKDGITDSKVDSVPKCYRNSNPTSLIQRLKAGQCEWCGAENADLEIHHVKKLKNLKGKAKWEKMMIARKRKTLALCKVCHDSLHVGKLD